ncbi:hypothetical protein C8R47DRAFT_1026768 [Mycena vitilis]|nr:hypothetical protein C8R47DRAFT_1026768 [Mycena vitilis]
MACLDCSVPADCDTSYDYGLPLQSPPFSTASIQHLLDSNEAPADNEIHTITSFVCHFQHAAEALIARMDISGAALDQRIAVRDEVTQRVQRYTAVLSPVRRVPPEIISEIFSWILPQSRRVVGSVPIGAPWYLGHISSRWRDTALALPSLWTSITVFHTQDYPCNEASLLSMVHTQLVRSANASIQVDFEWRVDGEKAAPFLDALHPHASRWASLRLLRCYSSYQVLQSLRPARGRLSQLNALEIDDVRWEPEASTEGLDIFSAAPNLREILLTDPTFAHLSPALVFPWERITRYRGVATVQHFANMLPTAPHLVEAALGFTIGIPEVPDNIVITLPRLRRLYLERGSFLDHLTAPQLEYFSCDTVESMLPFVERSSCQLTTLVLAEGSQTLRHPFSLPAADVISLLQHIPTLQNLVLEADAEYQEENHRILSALTLTGTSSDICPDLTYLGYGSADDADVFSDGVLMRMILSRLDPYLNMLSYLRLLCAPPEDEDEAAGSPGGINEIETLRDAYAGLDVMVLRDPSHFIAQARSSFVLA